MEEVCWCHAVCEKWALRGSPSSTWPQAGLSILSTAEKLGAGGVSS